MAVFHDEVEIEDFTYDEENELYHYPCPCGDRFEITKTKTSSDVDQEVKQKTLQWDVKKLARKVIQHLTLAMRKREMLEMGEDVATCPSCSLIVRVIYDPDLFTKLETVTTPPRTMISDTA